MPSGISKATPITTTELCQYNCGQVANYQFAGGKLCCSKHQNSCPGKRKQFSDMDHSARTAKSLETRIREGITKSSREKAKKTCIEQGIYERIGKQVQQRLLTNQHSNNPKCPIVPYKTLQLKYQGTYEFAFLEKLEAKYSLSWIDDNVKRGPAIWYDDPSQKERLYISDFIIGNVIYEIKSGWTWNHKGADPLLEELNKAKLAKCIALGYEVILVINGEEIRYE